jgi:hypothetical protein
MEPGQQYTIDLHYQTAWAESLIVLESLPYGVNFVSGTPVPFAIGSDTLETPDNPPFEVLQWMVAAGGPLGSVDIQYVVEITNDAATSPSVALRCTKPESGSLLHQGNIIEKDAIGAESKSRIGGDQEVDILLALVAPSLMMVVSIVAVGMLAGLGALLLRRRTSGGNTIP